MAVKEKGLQLYFRDDRTFEFRYLPIMESSLVEKIQDIPIAAWGIFYKLQKKFDGFKKISTGLVTICYARDFLFDLFNQMSSSEKPEQGDKLEKGFVTKIAEAKCYAHEQNAKSTLFMDKMTIILGISVVLLALALGAKAAF